MAEPVHESGYTTPLPLQAGGEQIELLVRVRDKERGYYFNIVFVENQNWPKEKKDALVRLLMGWRVLGKETVPYPVKLRFRLDSIDGKGSASIDQVTTERTNAYLTFYPPNGTEIWRANVIFAGLLEPGVYRVRIDNLHPMPEIDFDTLFQFKHDSRKY